MSGLSYFDRHLFLFLLFSFNEKSAQDFRINRHVVGNCKNPRAVGQLYLAGA